MKDHLTRNPHRIDTFFTHTHTPFFLGRRTDTHTMNYTGSVNGDNTWASTGMFHGMWRHDLGGNVHWSCYHGNLLPIGSVSLLTLKQCQLLSVFEILYHLSCHLLNVLIVGYISSSSKLVSDFLTLAHRQKAMMDPTT